MPKKLPHGFLIIFEGIDGAGKTTQLQLAEQSLSDQGWPAISRRNLGGTPIGEELRKVMKDPTPRPAQTNLYISAAIQAALLDQVSADRRAGKLILMDRGPLSLAAYEIFGGGLNQVLGWPHVDEGMNGLRPELLIIYKAGVKSALERAKRQAVRPDYFESQPLAYFERVAKGYDVLAGRYANTVTIGADRSIEAVRADTMAVIERALAALKPA